MPGGRAMNHNAIGGSDIAAIMGVHPYRTPYDVWLRITQGFEQPDSPVLRRGRLMEPVVRELAKADLGMNLLGPAYYNHAVHGFLVRASIDDVHLNGLIKEPVEFKTVSSFARQQWGDEGTHDVPLHYLYQLQWYLWASEAPRGHLVALIGLDDLRRYIIQADKGLHGRMIKAAKAFWQRHVIEGLEPSKEGSSLAADFVAKKYDNPTEEYLLDADLPKAPELIRQYWAAKALADEAEVRFEAIKTELKGLIGNAKGIKAESATFTWAKNASRSVVDWEAVAKEAGASAVLIGKHTSQKEGSRVFRVTARGQQ